MRPGIVHRIDKDTSGVLVIAKTDDAHLHLSNQFKQHSVKRQYQCLVWGVPEKEHGVVNAALGRHPVRRKDISIVENVVSEENENKKGKSAVTHWRLLQSFEFAALLACRLETGRTHQIRVHLTHLGYPVLCDRLYGGRSQITRGELSAAKHGQQAIEDREVVLKRQALHARCLSLQHPITGEPISFSAPLPADMQTVLDVLRQSPR